MYEQAGADRVFLQDVMVPHLGTQVQEACASINGKQKMHLFLYWH
jgi:hypothetical protein